MKIFFLLLSLLCLYALFQAGVFYYRLQLGKDIARNAKPYAQEPENPAFRLLVLGDSTAVGTGAEKPEFSVAGQVGARYPEALIENRGGNGAKVADVLTEVRRVKKDKFDVIMLHVGGNDVLRFTDLEQLEKDVYQLLRTAKNKADAVTLTTSGNIGTAYFLPFGSRWLFEKRTREVRDLFMKAAADNEVAYVDLFLERDQDPFWSDPETHYAHDFLHPSNAGYALWFKTIGPVLQAELERAGLVNPSS